jgi:uncharacterized protein
VIVLDSNLLLYAYDSTTRECEPARAWIESIFSGSEPVGLPWLTIWAFVRLTTNPRLPGDRYTPAEAADLVEEWLNLPQVDLLAPGPRFWPIYRRMLIEGQVRGPQTTDAALAALTVECGGMLYTVDRGFARYPGLRFINPLNKA